MNRFNPKSRSPKRKNFSVSLLGCFHTPCMTEVFSLRGPRFWIEPVHNRIFFDSSLKVQLLGCFTILSSIGSVIQSLHFQTPSPFLSSRVPSMPSSSQNPAWAARRTCFQVSAFTFSMRHSAFSAIIISVNLKHSKEQ